MSRPPQLQPDWQQALSADVDAAVVARVRECKDEIVAACLQEIDGIGQAPIRFFLAAYRRTREGDFLSVLEAYLALDEQVLADLPERHVRRLADITEKAQLEIAGLLTTEQRLGFESEGIRPLLARVDYPSMAAFFSRMNALPAPGRNENDYRGLFCPKPFTYAEVGSGGQTFVCCPLMLPTVVGDASDGTFMEVWNSDSAQAIRKSILDGDFSYCIEKTCGALQNGTLQRREEVTDPYHREIIDNSLTHLEKGPETLLLNYDRSCNLACPTCRIDRIALTGEAKETAESIQAWATGEHLKDARRLHITGSGDAFGSSIFHSFLRDFDPRSRPQLRISVGTNGLLCTEKNWERICADAIDMVVVSADAASQATYDLNRGGDFGLLVENLRFLGRLRSSGRIQLYGLNFVVQANNYREMEAFVSLGQAVHADSVCFQQLTNWGTFSHEEFEARAVHRPAHPEHEHFRRMLADPIFDLPIVDIYNLGGLRRESA